MLYSDDEEYIKRAIEDKSTADGTRHDSVLYINKRAKKKDFLSIANYHLYRKGKTLIKSSTTVLNRGRPRNKSSRSRRNHHKQNRYQMNVPIINESKRRMPNSAYLRKREKRKA